MNIVIVGAGEVGRNVAETLSGEEHDIYIVEQDETKAKNVESLDMKVILGNGARPQVLAEAGVVAGGDVDLLVACTDRDEINILSCWIAHRAGVKRVISRARSLEFTDSPTTWGQPLGIDMMISPERSVAVEILDSLTMGSAARMAELLDGRAAMYAFHVEEGAALAGKSLKDIRIKYKDLVANFVYVEKEGTNKGGVVPNGDTVLLPEDMCYVVTYRETAWKLEGLFRREESQQLRRVFVVGGGKVGFQVVQRMQEVRKNVQIFLIERDRRRREKLLDKWDDKNVKILEGDGADPALLKSERIKGADAYVCATDSDEVNLVYAAIAKEMGARKTIAVVRRKLYQQMSRLMPVDVIVDLNEAMASVILGAIRYPGHTRALSVIKKIDAEMLEMELPDNHRLANKPLKDLGLPRGVLVALMEHEGKVFLPDGATRMESGDHIILFASTSLMREAMELFGDGGDEADEGGGADRSNDSSEGEGKR